MDETEVLQTHFAHAARDLATQFNWRFLPEPAWTLAAGAVWVETQPESPVPTAEQARRSCLTVYARVLHDACQDARRADQAYAELYNYLWPQAYRKEPQNANELTQDTIVLVHRSFHEPALKPCREPAAFLRFAQFKLLAAHKEMVTQLRRQHPVRSLERNLDDDQVEEQHLTIANPSSPASTPDWAAWQRLWVLDTVQRLAVQVVACCVLLWRQRLDRQLQAVILTYLDYSQDQDIATRLGTTVSNVPVLRSRGISKLQRCVQTHFVAQRERYT